MVIARHALQQRRLNTALFTARKHRLARIEAADGGGGGGGPPPPSYRPLKWNGALSTTSTVSTDGFTATSFFNPSYIEGDTLFTYADIVALGGKVYFELAATLNGNDVIPGFVDDTQLVNTTADGNKGGFHITNGFVIAFGSSFFGNGSNGRTVGFCIDVTGGDTAAGWKYWFSRSADNTVWNHASGGDPVSGTDALVGQVKPSGHIRLYCQFSSAGQTLKVNSSLDTFVNAPPTGYVPLQGLA